MNKQDFIKLLHHPETITPAEIKQLEEVAANFPFCQAAHILIAKGNVDYGSMMSDKMTRKAALFAGNRKYLKRLFQKKTGKQPPATNTEKQINPKPEPEPEKTSKPDISDITPLVFSQILNENLKEKNLPKKNREDFLVDRFLSQFPEQPSDPKSKEITDLQKIKPLNSHPNFHKEDQEELSSFSKEKTTKEPEKKEDDIYTQIQKNLEALLTTRERQSQPPATLRKTPQTKEPTSTPDQEDKQIIKEKKATPSSPVTGSTFVSSAPERETEVNESELLLNYLDFLKNKQKSYKRDPEKINLLIDKFIKEEPVISPLRPDKQDKIEGTIDLAQPRISKPTASETFAMILEKQGKILKAIEIYQELIVKNPGKKAYFAARINELKNKI